MYGELSSPSYCTGYNSSALFRSKTGIIALRLAEVQQPKTVATWSSRISLLAFSAKVGQSEAPSSTDGRELLAEHAAGRVDLLDGEQLGVPDGDLADGHGAGQRVEQADLDGVAGPPAGASLGGASPPHAVRAVASAATATPERRLNS